MWFFKKKENVNEKGLYSPVIGNAIPLTAVKDETFSKGTLGPGFAVQPTDDKVCAPISGKIEQIFDTLHAFTIVGNNGAEVLVHIGVDTVNLQGKHFKALAKSGDKVNVGDPIIKADFNAIKAENYQTSTIVILTSDLEESNFKGLKMLFAENEVVDTKKVCCELITK